MYACRQARRVEVLNSLTAEPPRKTHNDFVSIAKLNAPTRRQRLSEVSPGALLVIIDFDPCGQHCPDLHERYKRALGKVGAAECDSRDEVWLLTNIAHNLAGFPTEMVTWNLAQLDVLYHTYLP